MSIIIVAVVVVVVVMAATGSSAPGVCTALCISGRLRYYPLGISQE